MANVIGSTIERTVIHKEWATLLQIKLSKVCPLRRSIIFIVVANLNHTPWSLIRGHLQQLNNLSSVNVRAEVWCDEVKGHGTPCIISIAQRHRVDLTVI